MDNRWEVAEGVKIHQVREEHQLGLVETQAEGLSREVGANFVV